MSPRDVDPRQPDLFDTRTAGDSGHAGSDAHGPARATLPDARDREDAVDPGRNVVLEASAGTGKTSVLVQRYLNLLAADVDPAHILAITFTRKAAAEMRERIVTHLRRQAATSVDGRRRWLRLRDRLGEMAISTIDAFCLSLLREFPLEADLDPGFEVADETVVARLLEQAIEQAVEVADRLAASDPDVAFLLTELSPAQLRRGLRSLVERRAIALPALAAHVSRLEPAAAADAVREAARAMLDLLEALPGGRAGWVADGPLAWPPFALLADDLATVAGQVGPDSPAWARAVDGLFDYFLTQTGEPRRRLPAPERDYPGREAVQRHRAALDTCGARIQAERARLERRLDGAMARAVHRLALVAERVYLDALREHDVLDFTATLERAVRLLEQMDEFSRSRFRLESRYHHVLIDEFQDTNRLQWRLVSLLVQAWGEGEGLVGDPLPPTIFIVGDRKQSIYRFRDADVALFDEAARHIAALRPGDRPRRSLRTSFRAVPPLLAFVNDLFGEVEHTVSRPDGFRYEDTDRFPVEMGRWSAATPLGLVVGRTTADVAERVAGEVVRLLDAGPCVRDRERGVPRPIQPGDVAILFRARESHREYEAALERRGVPTYVYKGLGFFDADEIKDACALVRYLADPRSPLREAALLRSRICRVTDAGLHAMRAHLGAVLSGPLPEEVLARLEPTDAEGLRLARDAARRWLGLVDRVPPADLLDLVLRETAYAFELKGPRRVQARENLKKFRGLVRRIQNRGYATFARLAEHLDRLSVGDESNAVVDAVNAVNLMTVHAAKGLEFPVIFVVNLSRGTGGGGPAVRVLADAAGGAPLVSVRSGRSDADLEEQVRDREETKRLLYVALTRARDRLYLASVLGEDGRLRPRPGSLADVLPASFRLTIEQAGQVPPGGGEVAWSAREGATHQLRVVPLPDSPGGVPAGTGGEHESTHVALVGPLAAGTRLPVTTVRDFVGPPARKSGVGPGTTDDGHDVLVGRLVHRLFQVLRPDDALVLPLASCRTRARALLSDEELESCVDPDAVVAAACRTWRRLVRRDDVRLLLEGAEVLHEVPFTLREDPTAADGPRVVRGVVDCLVLRPDGEIVVLEIKTGRPAAWHARQLALYVRAARALYPDASVRGLLVRPGR